MKGAREGADINYLGRACDLVFLFPRPSRLLLLSFGTEQLSDAEAEAE